MPLLGLIVAVVALAADQASKLAILAHFAGRPFLVEHIVPTIDFELTANRGVSFGLFNGHGGLPPIVFTGLALGIVLLLAWWLWRCTAWHMAVSLGLIIGGAIGNNLIDRVRLGSVVDFISFYIGSWHWYVFNLADAEICVGVGILLLDSLLRRTESPK